MKNFLVSLILLLCLGYSFRSGAAPLCSEVYQETMIMDRPEGFIDLFILTPGQIQKRQADQKKVRKEDEARRIYFNEFIEKGLISPRQFLLDLTNQKPAALTAMEMIISKARDIRTRPQDYNYNAVFRAYKPLFREIMSLSRTQLGHMKPPQLIAIFSLFAGWNLIPTTRFLWSISKALENSLDQWGQKDLQNFASSRRLSPQQFSESFETAYRKRILAQFEKMTAFKKIVVLTAELTRGHQFTTPQMTFLLTKTIEALPKDLAIKPNWLNTLKALFRSLQSLRATPDSGVYIESVLRLETIIEEKLNTIGHTLSQGGRSRSTSEETDVSSQLREIVEFIERAYPGENKYFEYSDPNRPGLFDPVDAFYPRLDLVIEWDGRHHFFQHLNTRGEIDNTKPYVLRPADQLKDRLLEDSGYQVLRFNYLNRKDLKPEDIVELIGIERTASQSR